jgi:Ca2+-binding EF-hand superfamily protein
MNKRGAAAARLAPIDPNTLGPLPIEVQSDLDDAFTYYAKEGSTITSQEFHNILHNFGFSQMTNTMEELKRHGLDAKEAYTKDDARNVVSYRLLKGGGAEEQAKQTYELFDKR